MQTLSSVIDDELFMIEYGHHTISDIHEMYFTDFLLYSELIYKRKMENMKRQEEELKAHNKGSGIRVK